MTPQTFSLSDSDSYIRTWEVSPSGDVRYVCRHTDTGFTSVEYVSFADACDRIFCQGKNAALLSIERVEVSLA
jgi:hypothetical protein